MSWKEYELYHATCTNRDPAEIGWDHPVFDTVKQLMEEEKKFADNPIEVEEGVMQCAHCKSFRTYSYQKQVRKSDEGFTVFVFCFDCGKQSRHN